MIAKSFGLDSTKLTKMEFITAKKKTRLEFAESTRAFFEPKSDNALKCNPYSFTDRLTSSEHRIEPLQNRDEDILTCNNYNSFYKMKYEVIEEHKPRDMTQLVCSALKDEYSYSIHTAENSEKISVNDPEMYTFYCAAKFGEICSDPMTLCKSKSEPNCLKYQAGSANVDATLKCDERKYIIDDDFFELDSDPVCKQDGSLNEAAFFFTISGEEKKVSDTARCFKDYNCEKKSHLAFSCNDEKQCGVADETKDGILKCRDGNRQLTIYYVDKNNAIANLSSASSYTCNKKTGLYQNGTDIVKSRSRVSCDGESIPPPAPAEKGLPELAIYGIIAGIFLIFVAIIAAICFTISCCRKRRKEVVIAGKRGWLKLKNSKERLAGCQRIFDSIMSTTTPDTANNITKGLNFIDMLLETETHDPECWELAYDFLMRLQGALFKIEHNVWHMFSRYMYLQAKKIIDKHGWLAPKPITNKKRKGLIRAVAIKLLSLALGDPTNVEAEKMVKEGFRKLKVDAVSQYPHCGAMWSLIEYGFPHSDFVNNKPVKFDWKKFLGCINTIVQEEKIKIPKEDIIPGFGSITDQAAFALGGSINLFYKLDGNLATELFTSNCDSSKGGIQKSFFKGMIYSLYHNPAAIILPSCQMATESNETFVKDLASIVVESEWLSLLDKAMKVSTYYGRHLDAKKLLSRFTNRSIEELNTMNEEQMEFEDAVESKKDDLLSWFAKRTDKEELKKKQPMILAPNARLDSRIKGEGVKKVETKSKSNSNSSENGPLTPQDKGPAAATPPTPAASTPPDDAATPAVPVAPAAAAAVAM